MSYPTTRDGFHNYIGNAVQYLDSNAVRFAISAANKTEMDDKKLLWDPLWAKYVDPAQVNSQVRQNVKDMIADWKRLLTSIYNDIPSSVLTSTDASTLNIAIGTSRTNIAPADHAPVLQIAGIKHLQTGLRITDPENPNTNSMPPGQHVHLHVGIQDTPGSPIVWDIMRLMEVHKFLTTVGFMDADVAKKGYFRACYVNTRGEKGPFSEPISSTIA